MKNNIEINMKKQQNEGTPIHKLPAGVMFLLDSGGREEEKTDHKNTLKQRRA